MRARARGPALALVLGLPLLAGCLGGAPEGPAGPSAGPDLILHGGRVWTGVGGAPLAQALAVDGMRIAAVGADAEVLAMRGAGTELRGLEGALVLPGFRDQHAHLLEVAAGTGVLFPEGSPSENPYEPRMGAVSVAHTETGRASVAAYHAATKAAGKTPMDDWAADPASDCRAPSPVTPELKERLRFAMGEAAKQGLTTVVEPGLGDLGVWQALQEMEEDGAMGVRVLVRVAWGCIDEAAALGLRSGAGSPWAEVLGVKLYADGWLGPRTSALRQPYSDRPLLDGILFLEPGRAERDVARARDLGFHVASHAIGDRAIATMLDAYAAAGMRAGDRWSLEHVQVLAPELLDRMASMGVVGSIQLSFATSDMGFAEDALGPERARWAYAWRTAQQRGVPLAGGTDFPIEVLNPLWGLQRVVTRQELDGTPPGGWHPQERLPLEQALRLVTLHAAAASLEEEERGTLEAGKFADLVVLREDILAGPPEGIAGATVLLTMTNGRVTFEGAQAYPPLPGAAEGEPSHAGHAAQRKA